MITKVQENQTKLYFDVRIKIFKDGHFEVRKYDDLQSKKISGFELVEDQKDFSLSENLFKTNETSDTEIEDKIIRSDNLKRTRDKLIDLGYENWDKWKSFVTLTFADIVDVEEGNKALSKWLHMWKVRCDRAGVPFYYLCIPEYQKRGSIHYHMLTSLVCGSDFPQQKIKWTKNNKSGNWVRLDFYDLPGWSYGFSSAFTLQKGDPNGFIDESFEPVDYMCKYMFKDPDQRLWGNRKLIRSNNLDLPKFHYVCVDQLSPEFFDFLEQFKKVRFEGDKDRFLPPFMEFSGKSLVLRNFI